MAKKDASMGFMDWFKSGSPDTEEAKPAPKQSNEDLLKNIETLTTRLDLAERRATEAAVSVQRTSAGDETAPEAPMLDLSNLPDPFMEPDKYTKEYSKRNADFVRATLAFERQKDQTAAAADNEFYTKANNLWGEFQTAYPDYAKKPKAVKFATAEVTSRLAAEGKDVQAYMFSHKDAFMKDVIKEIDETVGAPVTPKVVEEEADRTGGLFGGSTPSATATEEGKTDMVKDLRDVQTKLGLY